MPPVGLLHDRRVELEPREVSGDRRSELREVLVVAERQAAGHVPVDRGDLRATHRAAGRLSAVGTNSLEDAAHGDAVRLGHIHASVREAAGAGLDRSRVTTDLDVELVEVPHAQVSVDVDGVVGEELELEGDVRGGDVEVGVPFEIEGLLGPHLGGREILEEENLDSVAVDLHPVELRVVVREGVQVSVRLVLDRGDRGVVPEAEVLEARDRARRLLESHLELESVVVIVVVATGLVRLDAERVATRTGDRVRSTRVTHLRRLDDGRPDAEAVAVVDDRRRELGEVLGVTERLAVAEVPVHARGLRAHFRLAEGRTVQSLELALDQSAVFRSQEEHFAGRAAAGDESHRAVRLVTRRSRTLERRSESHRLRLGQTVDAGSIRKASRTDLRRRGRTGDIETDLISRRDGDRAGLGDLAGRRRDRLVERDHDVIDRGGTVQLNDHLRRTGHAHAERTERLRDETVVSTGDEIDRVDQLVRVVVDANFTSSVRGVAGIDRGDRVHRDGFRRERRLNRREVELEEHAVDVRVIGRIDEAVVVRVHQVFRDDQHVEQLLIVLERLTRLTARPDARPPERLVRRAQIGVSTGPKARIEDQRPVFRVTGKRAEHADRADQSPFAIVSLNGVDDGAFGEALYVEINLRRDVPCRGRGGETEEDGNHDPNVDRAQTASMVRKHLGSPSNWTSVFGTSSGGVSSRSGGNEGWTPGSSTELRQRVRWYRCFEGAPDGGNAGCARNGSDAGKVSFDRPFVAENASRFGKSC